MSEKKEERIHVCFCGNDKVFPLILLSALSIAKYTSLPVTLYALTATLTRVNEKYVGISEDKAQILTEALKGGNEESVAKVIDVTDLYEELLGGGKNENSGYTPYTLLRLLIPRLNLCDRLIYLDADTMCCSDLAQLWNIDISDYEFAAVRDHMGQHFFGKNYINAGVLYLNFEQIQKTGLFEKGIAGVKNKKLYFSDQTVLNKYGKKILRLPRKFNEQRQAYEGETVIKHFCQGIKWTPFFHVYNIKQSQRELVRSKLKINFFEDVYSRYDELEAKYGFSKDGK